MPCLRSTSSHSAYKVLHSGKLLAALNFELTIYKYLCNIISLAEAGGGSIVTIDLLNAEKRQPNIEELLAKCGYLDLVDFYYEPVSYNWRLMKLIEEQKTFDFCYLDGGHDWYNTGYAFFLVDKLLQPGGWILFDDLDWTMEHIDAKWALKKPLEERITPQVRKVWELLVQTHPNYTNFQERGSWGYAEKIG